MLKVRVKFGTAQKEIEKAFKPRPRRCRSRAIRSRRWRCRRTGWRRSASGARRSLIGEYIAELRVDGRDVELRWSAPTARRRSPFLPKVKGEHKEELKELQGAAKDIAAMLPAQSERIDAMFLLQKRWPLAVWRERYLDHPLVGTIARRLIWTSSQRRPGRR